MSIPNLKSQINTNYNLFSPQKITVNYNHIIPFYNTINTLPNYSNPINQSYFPKYLPMNNTYFNPKKEIIKQQPIDDKNNYTPYHISSKMFNIYKSARYSLRDKITNNSPIKEESYPLEVKAAKEPKDHIVIKNQSNDFKNINLNNLFFDRNNKSGDNKIVDYFEKIPSDQIINNRTSNKLKNINYFNENENKNKEKNKKKQFRNTLKFQKKKRIKEQGPSDNTRHSLRKKIIRKTPLDSVKQDLEKNINEQIGKVVLNEQKPVKLKNSLNNSKTKIILDKDNKANDEKLSNTIIIKSKKQNKNITYENIKQKIKNIEISLKEEDISQVNQNENTMKKGHLSKDKISLIKNLTEEIKYNKGNNKNESEMNLKNVQRQKLLKEEKKLADVIAENISTIKSNSKEDIKAVNENEKDKVNNLDNSKNKYNNINMNHNKKNNSSKDKDKLKKINIKVIKVPNLYLNENIKNNVKSNSKKKNNYNEININKNNKNNKDKINMDEKQINLNEENNLKEENIKMDNINEDRNQKINESECKTSNLSKKNMKILENSNNHQEEQNNKMNQKNEVNIVIEEKKEFENANKTEKNLKNKIHNLTENTKKDDIKVEKNINENIKTGKIEKSEIINGKDKEEKTNLESIKKENIKVENELKENLNTDKNKKNIKNEIKDNINSNNIQENLKNSNNIKNKDINDINKEDDNKQKKIEKEKKEKLIVKSNKSSDNIEKGENNTKETKNETSDNPHSINQKNNNINEDTDISNKILKKSITNENTLKIDDIEKSNQKIKFSDKKIKKKESKEYINQKIVINNINKDIQKEESVDKDDLINFKAEGKIQNEKININTIKENDLKINNNTNNENSKNNNLHDNLTNQNNINRRKEKKEEKLDSKKNQKEENIKKKNNDSKRAKSYKRKLTPNERHKRKKFIKIIKKPKIKSVNKTESMNQKIKMKLNNIETINELEEKEKDKNTKTKEKKLVTKSARQNNTKMTKIKEELNLQKKTEQYFNPKDFKYFEVMGKGEYGKIYLAQWVKKDNQYYAMKIETFKEKEEAKKSQMTTKIIKEFLKSTNSEGVIKIFGDVCLKENNLYHYYVLMEKAERDMEQELIIRCNNNQFYSEKDIINVLIQLIIVLAQMQKNNIAHRDIKPQNILIIKGRYKICDFGEAVILKNNGEIIQTLSGTELYMSPILFYGMRSQSLKVMHNVYKSDVFSLGLCILLAATLNYDSLCQIREVTDMNQIKNVLIYYLSRRYSNVFISFLYRMLEVDEKKRPDFIQLESMLVKKQ